MNIAQALKEKNRISGRIVKIQNLILKYNRRLSNEASVENVTELWQNLLTEKANLVKIKTLIQRANKIISEDLVNLAEAKAMISYLSSLETVSGVGGKTEQIYDRKTGERSQSEYTIEYAFDVKEIRSKISEYQAIVEDLQDRIDNFNATTLVS